MGLILELWKKKRSVKEMLQWVTALTPLELQQYLSGMTTQNLNKSCNDLMKKAQKLGKNKKKEELESLKQNLFHLPGSSAPITRETLTPKSKKIAELKDENRGLKRSVSKMLSFSESLMDEHDALIDDQAALENEYSSTVEHMRSITNNIAGVAANCKNERDAFEQDLKVLQEQFNEQSERLNEIQEKLASYTPRNVNKRQKRAHSKINDLKNKISELEVEKQSISDELSDVRGKCEQAESENEQLKQQKIGLQKKVSHIKKQKNTQANEIDLLKEHNPANILKLESCAKELKEKNKELEQLTCLLEDDTISTFEDGKYVDEVREVIMELLAMNVSMSKVNDVIRTVLKKLAGKSLSRLPSKAVHSRLLVEAKHLADVQLGRAMLEEADPSKVVGNTLHGDGTTIFHRHYQDFEITTPSCQTYSMGLLELGKSDTEAIMDSFKYRVQEIAQALSSGENVLLEDKVAELVTSIKSTMSDQGPTNATFNEQLAELRKEFLPKVVEKWEELSEESKNSLEEMGNFYCKLHLLVNLGEEANKALKLFEHAATEGRNPLAFLSSNESGSCRLTRTACEAFHPRGSQTAGVSEYFDVHLSENGVESKLVEFIGNRFNIIFYNSAAVFYHKSHIQDFLFKWPAPNRLLQLVAKDIVEPVYLAGVRALGILDKIVTGPFFRLTENAKSVLDLNPHLKRMQECLEQWSTDASPLLEGATLFDEEVVPIHRDELFDSLFQEQSVQLETLTQEALEIIFNSWIILFERQAQDQLPGGKYASPSSEQLEQAANVPATNMASERDFGVFDLLLHLKPAARLISHEALVMWTNNKTIAWLNSLSPEEKEKCMADARANTGAILDRYKERKEKIFQQRKEKLLEKQRAKEEAERKLRQQRLNLVNGVTEMGGPWKSEKEIKDGLTRFSSEKERQKALVTQLQFQKVVLQAKAPTKEHFQQGKTVAGKRVLFTAEQLVKHLMEVLELNKFEETESENEGGLTYRSSDDRAKNLSDEKAKLAKKLRDARQKVLVTRSKKMLPKIRENPLLLVGKRVMHNCIEDGSEQAEWFNATVLRLAEDVTAGVDPEYIIKYDIDEDDDEWTMPLIKDLDKGDLILLN